MRPVSGFVKRKTFKLRVLKMRNRLETMRTILIALCIVAVASPWVIYRRNQKKRIICKAEPITTNGTADETMEETPMAASRRRRDIVIDPVHKQPIIYLDNNSSMLLDDGDFDIVSDQLTPEELKEVKRRIVDTCNALNSN
ncbi:unnamed protein product [Cylicocyclus nassatus]|uniref:Uncharacterized protein n=1 Tax=Cylicocyclus nassatus TaxID=53992 RepID=A0AA36M8N7_CYLNA|nr:unnamed protein product [Cylicocyclus nassatus]